MSGNDRGALTAALRQAYQSLLVARRDLDKALTAVRDALQKHGKKP